MKIIVAALACGIFAIGVFVFRQNAMLKSQAAQIFAINAELSEQRKLPKAQPLDLQIKCAEQARVAFLQAGYKQPDIADYQSHYNAKLGRCIIETQNTSSQGKELFTFRNVYDAVERRDFGTYVWRADPVRKYWEVAPFQCEVDAADGEKQLCHSEEEFSKLVQTYLTD